MAFLHLLFLSVFASPSTADPLYSICGTEEEFNSNSSTYGSNLNHLVSTLSSKAFATNFASYTTGTIPDYIYAFYLCRGDTNRETCRSCFSQARSDIQMLCPNKKEASIWYDFCQLSYSNPDNLFVPDIKENTRVFMFNTQDLSADQRLRFEILATSLIGRKTMIQRVTIFLSVGTLLLICTIICLIWMRKRRDKGTGNLQNDQMPVTQGTNLASKLKIEENSMEFSLIKFSSIVEATNNFSSTNKLGQGGFGSVYKGHLPSGESMAVKRLDAFSGQGLEEFINEIKLIAKLQHQNLVKLLGYCIEGDEKLLVYEYMPNNSLDYHLFDLTRKEQLDWSTRFAIIDGIAQGLLYLHKYSRVRIIHRDLKASNILLDLKMKPKISDFGLARISDASTTPTNTNRIVGTYGYMSPEYAMEGLFSVKSDIFSFGVLMLEIISGKRNTSFHKSGKALNLLVYAWELWKNGKWLDFVDPSIGNKILSNEVSKCIIVALMCVQENAADRPLMSDIITMLGSEYEILQDPKKPAFFTTGNEGASDIPIYASQNDITLTDLEGR